MAKKISSRLRASLAAAEDLSKTARRPSQTRARSGPPAAKAGYWMYGTHAVDSALNNPRRICHELLATQEVAAGLPRQLPVQPRIVTREELDSLCGRDAVHQGIALRVEPLTPPDISEVLAERDGPVLVLDQVTDPRNIGAILRSAAAFGAAGVVVQDRNTPPETGTMAKAASGGLDIVPLLRETNLSRALATLQKEGLWVVGLDAGGGRLDRDALGPRRTALVLGAEGAGLRRLTRETCDEISSIYMPGDMESLNVSNAATVALYELTRPGTTTDAS
ncbi:23S rRNA (guanosine(2251)-2'-O)-methyltransferase RlmB [Oecophyllibacter saccharovorans]|uniref:23S rRNA (guanosine(2251)-2'-O)-methyltransferase RlmB n=1 Tax=Oecophyllibacter saccharovorans TaxID=2558360 RepID=UPI0011442273|nr:23S rRNA (guanosine(2251)-2'-O)-methyltransferase RlmB [Oecophyllibacter saccharovorans]QDH15433.1 23S rRNA (guanosine(2251)-2'-O)-methyltransferase RlmB [Oecophyllibacter saccharovorans]TPW36453.1 23S rRNA (guanosine(2251)-2'-O)-methyltransferase RlmB [Oecophyllibacter saccharovorans]